MLSAQAFKGTIDSLELSNAIEKHYDNLWYLKSSETNSIMESSNFIRDCEPLLEMFRKEIKAVIHNFTVTKIEENLLYFEDGSAIRLTLPVDLFYRDTAPIVSCIQIAKNGIVDIDFFKKSSTLKNIVVDNKNEYAKYILGENTIYLDIVNGLVSTRGCVERTRENGSKYYIPIEVWNYIQSEDLEYTWSSVPGKPNDHISSFGMWGKNTIYPALPLNLET